MYFLLAKGLAVLAVVAALVWAWHLATEHYRDQGRAEIQTLWDADKAARMKAQTDMTLLWDKTRQAAELAGKERDEERAKRLAEAKKRAKALSPAVAAVVVPAESVSVLNAAIDDSTKAPEPASATSATVAPVAKDSNVGLITDWAIEVISMYDTCRVRVGEWQAFYRGLQDAQPKEVSP